MSIIFFRSMELYYEGTVVNRNYWKNDTECLCLEGVMERSNRPVCLVIGFRGDTSSRYEENGEISVEVDSIDYVMEGRRVTMIKMDIEGAELEVLHGAKKTFPKYKTLLAICVYHKREDLFTIPQYIKSLIPEYRLFLRAYEKMATELVLYAVL